MTEKQILKSIKALAAGECANYHGGFCAETDRRCHLINPKYDSIRDGMIDCDYFLECVLPANWELSDLVSYALWYDEAEDNDLPSNMKRCEVCKALFVPANARQKYCKGCAAKVNRDQTRERMYLQRRNV